MREGKITPPELSAGTFTISNLGMYGIRRFVAVINPPQAAILAVGELSPRPVVRDGEVVVRTLMELTLTCDHRILYGAEAAEFLGRDPRVPRAAAQARALVTVPGTLASVRQALGVADQPGGDWSVLTNRQIGSSLRRA